MKYRQVVNRVIYGLSSCTLFFVVILNSAPALVDATSSSPWLSSSDPELTEIDSGMDYNALPTMTRGTYCYQTSVRTKKSTIYSSNETWGSTCAIDEPYGLATLTNTIEVGNDVAGPLLDYHASSSLVPVPNSGDVISMQSAANNPSGLYNYLINRDFTAHLTVVPGKTSLNLPNGTVSYYINTAPTATISDAAGNALALNYFKMSFSANGRYMVIDAPNKALLRVDMVTGGVLPFAPAFNYGGTFNKGGDMAISNDGLTVITSVDTLTAYDLSTCGAVPTVITGPVACDSKNLTSFWSSWELQHPTYNLSRLPYRLKFIGDTGAALEFYIEDTSSHYGRFILSPSGASVNTSQYLALGDSYSSGEGAYSYEVGTDSSSNHCHLSTKSYPYLIAQQQNIINNFHSVACSGATSDDVLSVSQYPNEPVPNSLGEWLPGVTPQKEKVQLSLPDIVTIGIGGNDVGFSHILSNCANPILASTCYSSYDDRMGLVDEIDNEYTRLVKTYAQVKSAAKSTTKIYVIGYPQVVDTAGSCGLNVRLDNEERGLANALINHINYVIQEASQAAAVEYVNVANAFSGHELCDASTSNPAVNGLTYGNDIFGFIGSESYHPDSLGQKYLASAVEDATNNFASYTAGNSSNAVTPIRSSTTAQALLSPYNTADNNTINLPVFTNKGPEAAYKDSGLDFTLSRNDTTLKPNTAYTVTIHSTPTVLGTFTTDAEGSLTVNTTIPSTVENGLHSLEITGDNLVGQPVNVQWMMAIGQTPGDFDGDGIADTQEGQCTLGVSGIDIDQDSIDDSCDPIIARSPTDVEGLYRARQGNPANGELSDSVYVERNTLLASSLLGITDYDPDGDGWSLVGIASNAQAATFARLRINDVGLTENTYDEYVPVVSARSNTDGCIELSPSSLAQVSASSPITLQTIKTNANTCRSVSSNIDLDGNGVADNTDSLYRLRIGNSAFDESSADMFIERNINTAEAAIGVSDYDDNADGWAKVGEFSSSGTYVTIGLINPASDTLIATNSTALSMSQINEYTAQQIAEFIPVIAVQDSTGCHNYVPNIVSLVVIGQARGAQELTTPLLSCTEA